LIIGVSGKAGAGKGEFAKVAQQEFGATIVSFASGVKEEVSEWLRDNNVGFDYKNLYGSQEDKEGVLKVQHTLIKDTFALDFAKQYAEFMSSCWHFTARSLMQYWGTEYRRMQDPDYWVKKAIAKCKGYGLYIIDDVRFPNEAAAIKNTGGKLVRVIRFGSPIISNSDHPSETALDDYKQWHYKIPNESILPVYHNEVRKVIREIVDVK
jgi:hypothetical protein